MAITFSCRACLRERYTSSNSVCLCGRGANQCVRGSERFVCAYVCQENEIKGVCVFARLLISLFERLHASTFVFADY